MRLESDIVEIFLATIDKKLNDLKTLRKELSHLANNCHGDDRPNCPILEALSKK